MKYSRLVLTLCVLATAFSAQAASVVMVQFGSFETNDEAQKRLATIKTVHADVLGSLPASVREVKLPPDNLTVYRTQAGPLNSRADAQSLCSKLANTGDECYVVETAMAGTPVPAANVADVATPPAMAVGMGNSTNGSALSNAAPIPPAPAANVASTGPALAPLSATASPSPDMQAALDRAATVQNTTASNPPVATAAAKPGFWSRVNPFGATQPVASAPAPALTPDVTPVPDLVPLAPGAMAANAALPTPPQSSVAYTPSPASAMVVPATDDASLQLPPPPAPLMAPDKNFANAAPIPPAPPAPVPPAPPMFAAAPPAPPLLTPPHPTPIPAGNVENVEEAKHVPLSDAVIPTVPALTPPPAAVPLLPSATVGMKSLWAQVGQFKDTQSALAFWQHYRETHPDYPATRIRVASSLQQQYHSIDRVWLRVGPFAREGFIRNLCNSIRQESVDAKESDPTGHLNCGLIQDSGISAPIRGNSAAAGYLNGSRYKR